MRDTSGRPMADAGDSGRPTWLIRDQVLERIDRTPSAPLTLLVAPAGYGKTTVLAQYLERFSGQVVRWRPRRGTTAARTMLTALCRTLPGAPQRLGPVTVETFLRHVEHHPGPVLLTVDDLHLIHGTDAESALEEIVLLAPPNLRLLAAGQRLPGLNLTRWELAGSTVLGPAELRLRASEVRRMLWGVYGSRLDFRQVNELDALTRGWPAALQLLRPALLHLPAGDRLPELDTVVGSLTHAYLDREVIGPLPARLTHFLEQVSTLPLLDAARCDALAGGSESAWLLDALAGERGLLERGRISGTFSWVPLLRNHLLRRLAERLGRDEPAPPAKPTPPAPQARPAPPARPPRHAAQPVATRAPAPAGYRPPAPALRLRCFGGFELTLGERSLDWTAVRPRARALLRMLAVHAGRPVHRELLIEAFWPERPPATGARCLHVAVSALRTVLEPGAPRGAAQLLVRSGEAYLLRIPPHGSCDLRRFETALADGLRSAAGTPDSAIRALREALDTYTGELLPEDGPAEWVVDHREHYRRAAGEAALTLAKLELACGRPLLAAQAGARGVEIDPFRDDAWQTLITAHQQCGDTAAAERSRKGHARMLLSLGLADQSLGGPGR